MAVVEETYDVVVVGATLDVKLLLLQQDLVWRQ